MATKKTAKKKPAKKGKKPAEVRGGKLLHVIKSAIPGAGFVKLDPNGDGRRAFFEWRAVDYLVSSRLHVRECGFGRAMSDGIFETETTVSLTKRLKAAVA